MKNKIIIALISIIVIISGVTGFVFYKKNEIGEIRKELTDINYQKEFNLAVNKQIDEIMKIGKFHKAHQNWIKEFIIEDIKRGNEKKTTQLLVAKLRMSNLHLNQLQRKEIEMKILEIAQINFENNLKIEKKYKAYKKDIDNSIINKNIELFFFGKSI